MGKSNIDIISHQLGASSPDVTEDASPAEMSGAESGTVIGGDKVVMSKKCKGNSLEGFLTAPMTEKVKE
jgi:hypothetical protein